MKKFITIFIIAICLTSCIETKSIKIPENIQKSINKNQFDTLLYITGESNTYYFNYEKNFIMMVSNDNIKPTITEDHFWSIFFIILLVILFLLLIILKKLNCEQNYFKNRGNYSTYIYPSLF